MDHASNRITRSTPTMRAMVVALGALLSSVSAAAGTDALWSHKQPTAADLLPPAQAFALVAAEQHQDYIDVSWSIAPGYYLYRKRLAFAAEPAGSAALGTAQLPVGAKLQDEQGDNEVYRDLLTARLPLHGGRAPTRLRVRFQGCADIGVCYPPQTQVIDVVASTP